jgi:cell division protein FtsN
MNPADRSDRRAEKNERQREIVFSLSPAQTAGGFVMLCLGYAVVFFLGVVMGRGYVPESAIPELAGLMPEASVPAAPRIVPEEEHPADPDALPEPPAPVAPPGRDEDAPFTRADLDYRDRLKDRRQSAPPSRGVNGHREETGRKARVGDRKTDGGGAARTRKSESATTPENAGAPAKSGKTRAQPTEPAAEIYRYVYQVASYRDRVSCDGFAQRLRAAGYAARTEQSEGGGVTWFRTVVEFTGRPDDTEVLREKLKGAGAPGALLRSKTPVR